jgi:regulator of cell morphogenesis and NO signaling
MNVHTKHQPVPPALGGWEDVPLADLVAHLAATHHAYLRAELPRLTALLDAAAQPPGPHQDALREAHWRLARFGAEMVAHLDYEEQVVFPLIVGMERGEGDGEQARRQLAMQAAALEAAHVNPAADLDELHRICDTVPASAEAEPALAELMNAFAGLIADTHQHLVLENEILVPRALGLLTR